VHTRVGIPTANARAIAGLAAIVVGTTVAETAFMRLFPRADRQQFRLGNVLADVSGEIMLPPQKLADGTGAHYTVEPRRARRRATTLRY
jgi:hypothetical protein